MNPRSAIIMSASVALAITVIVFGHLLFSKKTTALDNIRDGSVDTSGWKTYTNDKHGFTVMYPPYLKAGAVSDNSVLGTYQVPVRGLISPVVRVREEK